MKNYRACKVIVFLPVCMSEDVSLPLNAKGWSVVCNCGIFWVFYIVSCYGLGQLKALYTLEMSNYYGTQIIK